MRAPITFMLACACASVTPSFRRANDVSQWKSRVMFEGRNASGRQICAAARSKALPSGSTPTMVCGMAVELNDAVDDAGIGAELALPQGVAEDGHLVLAELILVGQERPAKRGLDAEDVEVARGYTCTAQLNRLGPAGHRHVAAGLGGMKSKTVLSLCQSRKFSVEMPFRSPCGGFSRTRTIRSGSS